MIGALILAAGASSRMGSPKPLVRVGGRTMLARVLESTRGARISDILVVLGADADRVRALPELEGVRVVENPAYAQGMSSSLRRGVDALAPETEAFLVVLGDSPFVRSATLDALIDARARTAARIVLPVYRGIRGNPVLIDRSLAGEVEGITGDRGCRALRLRHPEETVEVPVDDPGVVIDLDTAEDVRRAEAALAGDGSLDPLARERVAGGHPLAPSTAAPRTRMRGRIDLLARVAELERKREPFCLAVVTHVRAPTSGKPGFKAIVRANGELEGWVGGSCSRRALLSEARLALEEGAPRVMRLHPETEPGPEPEPGTVDRVLECDSGGAMEIYLEPHGPVPQLFVVGDSPLAESLTSLGRFLGFRAVAVGPGLDPARFPDADELVPDVADLANRLDAESYGVVATMASYDGLALEALLRSPARYVALVASRRRAALLFDELRSRGLSEATLGRVHNPAGVDIAARTPEEIAVSVAAEVVRERNRAPPPASREARGLSPAGARPAVAIDPVCHMEVEPDTTPLRSAHAGVTYYFCSEGCQRRFDAEPATFLS